MSAQQIKQGDDVNCYAVSYDENGQNPKPVARPCDSCGDAWQRGPLLDTGGARYLINGSQWLCCACMVATLVSHYQVKI